MSTALARRLATGKIHYGWVVLAATFLTMLVVAGAVGAPGVFIVPLQREFGWTAADISAALAIRFLLFGLIGPFAAAFMNRFGVRRMMLISLGIVTIGLLLSLGMSQLWQLVLLWGVVIGLGMASLPWCWAQPSPPAGFRTGAGLSWGCCPPARPLASWLSCRCSPE